jgi:stage II sporulation protein AA (anti-sigma F factor antagonist)
MREEVDPILEKTPIREVFFDFQETVFCDSSGIGLLMGRYRKMRQLGGKVVAVNVDSQMKRLLMLSGIHKLIQIQEGRSHGR